MFCFVSALYWTENKNFDYRQPPANVLPLHSSQNLNLGILPDLDTNSSIVSKIFKILLSRKNFSFFKSKKCSSNVQYSAYFLMCLLVWTAVGHPWRLYNYTRGRWWSTSYEGRTEDWKEIRNFVGRSQKLITQYDLPRNFYRGC